MPALTRVGTNPMTGASDPGRSVSPAHDYHALPVTMAVAVQRGQLVGLNNVGKGVLAGGAVVPFGVATEKVAAGRRVALLTRGPMSGYTGATPGDPVYAAATNTGEVWPTGTVVVGKAMEDDAISGENTIFFDLSAVIAGAGETFNQGAAVADLGAETVGAALGAFTDPPSAAEMAALRTFVNALRDDVIETRAKLNELLDSLQAAGTIAP